MRKAKPLKQAAPAAIVAPTIIPSAPQIFSLRQLNRAPENVRHTRVDEDVEGLAKDIVAHGLLQSLIGYRDGEGDALKVQIVGGGRRLQALDSLMMDEVIDGDFPVPVLIRDKEDAIELSLAENLQQRTMSPVDEFLAFRALMANGTNSAQDLAKRFGFSERVVKQRLRLAELSPEILDALALRSITLDAAMTYAATQDQALQSEIFKVEAKKTWKAHDTSNIRHALSMKGIKSTDPLFIYVGEADYLSAGGTFEDDLFNEPGDAKVIANPGLLRGLAAEKIDAEIERFLPQRITPFDLAPTIVGAIKSSDLRIRNWNNQFNVKAPSGFVQVERYEHEPMWKTIRNNGIDVHVIVGIDDKGELAVRQQTLLVPKDQKEAVAPSQQQRGYVPPTPEEQAAAARDRGVWRHARRLAVPSFTGTPVEGRTFWPEGYAAEGTSAEIDGKQGWLVPVQVFVTAEEIEAVRSEAEARYDQELAEREAREKAAAEKKEAEAARYAELVAMEPPAIVVLDGEAWARADDATFAPLEEQSEGGGTEWLALLANYRWAIDEIGDVFVDRAEFDGAMAAAEKAQP